MSSFFGFKKSAKQEDAVDKGPVTHEVILHPPQSSNLLPPKPKQDGDDDKAQQLRAFLDEHRAAHPCDPEYEPYEIRWMNNEMMYHRVLRSVRSDIKQAKKRILVRWHALIPDRKRLSGVAATAPKSSHPTKWRLKPRLGSTSLPASIRTRAPSSICVPGEKIPNRHRGRSGTWSGALSAASVRAQLLTADLMQPGQESITIVVDFHGASLSTMPSLPTARHVANILQAYYCERLGRAFVVHMPRFISAFFNALSPFLDPVTKDKIRFNDNAMTEFIEPDQLDAQFHGGTYNYKFDFPTYWSSLTQRCGISHDGRRTA